MPVALQFQLTFFIGMGAIQSCKIRSKLLLLCMILRSGGNDWFQPSVMADEEASRTAFKLLIQYDAGAAKWRFIDGVKVMGIKFLIGVNVF